MNPINYGQK